MTEEFKRSEVTFKYYLPDNQDDLWLNMLASDMHLLLREIDDKCRSLIKYSDTASEETRGFAQQIRDMICDVDLDKIS